MPRIPHDLSDEALLVWADQLQEQRDPRGEFVVLQCRDAKGQLDRKGQHRAGVLARKHRQAFLGGLAKVATNAVFRRGLLVELALGSAREAPFVKALGEDAWAAVEAIDFQWQLPRWLGPHLTTLIRGAPRGRLHTVRGLRAAAIPGGVYRGLVELGTELPLVPDPATFLEAVGSTFPSLRRLHLRGDGAVWRAPLFARLDECSLSPVTGSRLNWKRGTLHAELRWTNTDFFGLSRTITAGPPLERLVITSTAPGKLAATVLALPGVARLVEAAKQRGARYQPGDRG